MYSNWDGKLVIFKNFNNDNNSIGYMRFNCNGQRPFIDLSNVYIPNFVEPVYLDCNSILII